MKTVAMSASITQGAAVPRASSDTPCSCSSLSVLLSPRKVGASPWQHDPTTSPLSLPPLLLKSPFFLSWRTFQAESPTYLGRVFVIALCSSAFPSSHMAILNPFCWQSWDLCSVVFDADENNGKNPQQVLSWAPGQTRALCFDHFIYYARILKWWARVPTVLSSQKVRGCWEVFTGN